MKGRALLHLGVVSSLVLALSACEGVKKQLGYTKQPPDEFRVVSRAPLTLPPDYGLRPPEPGAPRPQEGTTADQARRAVFRMAEPEAPALESAVRGGRSLGELALLKSAGVEAADPAIRQIVDRETQQFNADSEGLLETLVFWRAPEPSGVLVDADAEAKRLRANAALGRQVTDGETPTIERRRKGLLEGIF